MSWVILALYLLGLPLLFLIANRRIAWLRPVPPVLLCYGTGIVVASIGLFPLDPAALHTAAEVTILLALPLLLYSTDVVRFVRSAPKIIGSFLLCVLSVCIMVLVVALWRGATVVDTATVSGMLVGLYTGGTPDMNAVGVAAGASETLLVNLNIADIVCGGIYFLLLVSIIPTVFGWVLRDFNTEKITTEENETVVPDYTNLLKAHLLAVGILAGAVGIVYLFTGEMSAVGTIVLLITTLSVVAGLSPTVRSWKGTYQAGEYWLLVFSLAIGTLADFTQIQGEILPLIGYMAAVLSGTVVLHLLLGALFRIDRDTVILTSVAALYGPAFVGQVASVLGNRALVFGTIAASLVGYALGNYLGLAMIPVVEWLIAR